MAILGSHFQTAKSNNKIGRVEFLPIYWYDALRNDAIGERLMFVSYSLHGAFSKLADIDLTAYILF